MKTLIVNGECEVNKFCNGELLTKFSKEWRDDSKWAVFVKYFDKVCSDISERGCTFDCMAMAIGNCFRTKESAEAHKEEILKILKGKDDEII